VGRLEERVGIEDSSSWVREVSLELGRKRGELDLEDDRTACGLWDPVAGRVPSRCLRPATVASPAAVPVAGRYRVVSERDWIVWKSNHFVNVGAVMAPKRNVDKGKAPMVEEEPRGPRTRSRSSALIIREQQERAQESEGRAAQIETSSDAYEEERLYGQTPAVGQARTEEVRTEE
ncbi:hypothetical protein ACLOJK_034372, partial [Asimina triloba]